MKKRISPLLKAGVSVVGICLAVSTAHAVPYASGLTNNAGTISFILNESADNVRIIWNGGATNKSLGSLSKGTITTNLAITGSFQVEVTKSAPGGWTQLSSDANLLNKFFLPRGLTINRNPASPYFGRIYVAEAQGGTTASPNVRTTTEGIFMLKADHSDAVGQGNSGRTGGLNFATGGSSSPYRLAIGEDDNLYICDWSDSTGGLYIADPDVTAGQQVLFGLGGPTPITSSRTHGSIAAVQVTGTTNAGDLVVYVIDEDQQTDKDSTTLNEMNSLWRYDINSDPLPSAVMASAKLFTPQIASSSQTMDLERGTNGYFYVSQARSAGNETCLFVTDSSGSVLFNSRQVSLAMGNYNDYLSNSVAVALSYDSKWIATVTLNGFVNVCPLIDGLPDLTNRVTFRATTSGNCRDLVYDAAGNLYLINSNGEWLRSFTPGGGSVAVTGSSGTFSVFIPETSATVTALDDVASESGDTAQFEITRVGDLTSALTVNFTLAGTAANGTDYQTVNPSVVIPANTNKVIVTITPIHNAAAELTENVTLTLLGSTNYTVGASAAATANIIDIDPVEISIETVQPSAYERITSDYITYQVVRRGLTNNAVTVNLTYGGGTAVPADYSAPTTSAFLDAGSVSATFVVNPVDDSDVESDETVIATVAAGSYAIGSPNSAIGTIISDDLAAETLLFSDDFDTNSVPDKWTTLFAANNGIADFQAEAGYDYVNTDGIPAAPGSSSGLGLKLTVNKYDSTGGGAAGLNLYPVGKSFSGDYAVRFHMYLTVGTASTTEHALFGVNHSGAVTNWALQNTPTNGPNGTDGLWFGIAADAANLGDFTMYLGTNSSSGPGSVLLDRSATEFTNIFKSPPFAVGDTGAGGSPGNESGSATPTWVDVEIRKIGDIVTLIMNGTTIMQTTNSSLTGGNVMLGYNDQFNSVGSIFAGVVYDNFRVVDLTGSAPSTPVITSVQIVSGEVRIDFTAAGATVADLDLVGSTTVDGTYGLVSGAGITELAPGSFRATAPVVGPNRFFRIRNN